MSAVSIICFSVDAIILVSCVPKTADPFSPARVFTFVWAFSIGLADLKLSLFQSPWSTYAWLVILLTMGAFLLGTFVAYILNLNKPLSTIRGIQKGVSRRGNINGNRFFYCILILFAAYIISYIAETALLGSVP